MEAVEKSRPPQVLLATRAAQEAGIWAFDQGTTVCRMYRQSKALDLQTSIVIYHGIYSTSFEHLLAMALDQWMASKGPYP